MVAWFIRGELMWASSPGDRLGQVEVSAVAESAVSVASAVSVSVVAAPSLSTGGVITSGPAVAVSLVVLAGSSAGAGSLALDDLRAGVRQCRGIVIAGATNQRVARRRQHPGRERHSQAAVQNDADRLQPVSLDVRASHRERRIVCEYGADAGHDRTRACTQSLHIVSRFRACDPLAFSVPHRNRAIDAARDLDPHERPVSRHPLHEAGVAIYVCGQSLAHQGEDPEAVAVFVDVAVSALTAVVNLQDDGYAYVPLGK